MGTASCLHLVQSSKSFDTCQASSPYTTRAWCMTGKPAAQAWYPACCYPEALQRMKSEGMKSEVMLLDVISSGVQTGTSMARFFGRRLRTWAIHPWLVQGVFRFTPQASRPQAALLTKAPEKTKIRRVLVQAEAFFFFFWRAHQGGGSLRCGSFAWGSQHAISFSFTSSGPT